MRYTLRQVSLNELSTNKRNPSAQRSGQVRFLLLILVPAEPWILMALRGGRAGSAGKVCSASLSPPVIEHEGRAMRETRYRNHYRFTRLDVTRRSGERGELS